MDEAQREVIDVVFNQINDTEKEVLKGFLQCMIDSRRRQEVQDLILSHIRHLLLALGTVILEVLDIIENNQE